MRTGRASVSDGLRTAWSSGAQHARLKDHLSPLLDAAGSTVGLENLSAGTSTDLDRLLAARVAANQSATNRVTELTALAVLVATYLFIAVWRSTSRSARGMVGQLQSLAAGDLSVRPTRAGPDEFGDMTDALNLAREHLSLLVEAIRGQSQHVAGAAVEVSRLSAEIASAAQRTSGEAQSIAITAGEVSTSIRGAVSERLQGSLQAFHRIAGDAREVVTAVGGASASVHRTTQAVTLLEERTERISAVLRAIESIAEQTHLLSLNATIEAARAGAAGQGFRVVASEVQSLATQTRQATASVTDAMFDLRSSSADVADGTGLVTSAMSDVAVSQHRISASIDQTTVAIAEASRLLEATSDRSIGIADSVTGLAGDADRTDARAAQMLVAAAQLERAAAELAQQVSVFRLVD